MLAAIVAFRVAERIRRPHAFLLLGLMVVSYLVATAPVFKGTVLPVRELGLSTLFGSLLVLVLSIPAAGRVFAWKPLAYLGYRSYSMFLIHQPTAWYVSEFLQKFLRRARGAVLLLLSGPSGSAWCSPSGSYMFVAVERPCIDWAKRAGREPEPEPATG